MSLSILIVAMDVPGPQAGTTCPEPVDRLPAKEKLATSVIWKQRRKLMTEKKTPKRQETQSAGSSRHRKRFVTTAECRHNGLFFFGECKEKGRATVLQKEKE
ncbi:hypothetical protein SESBI_26442 [Sesbania bispinosa]|nr:hypothetical protein SESBI_26442 [Sesbania bispinosa]